MLGEKSTPSLASIMLIAFDLEQAVGSVWLCVAGQLY